MADFKAYTDEPSIIHEFSMTECLADILLDDCAEICTTWLRREHPKCTFVYEPECSTLFLDGGHGLDEERIRIIQIKATAFVTGLMHGVEIARRPSAIPRCGRRNAAHFGQDNNPQVQKFRQTTAQH